MTRFVPLALLAALTSCVVSSGTEKLIETRELALPLEGAQRILIDVTRGHLEVAGEDRTDVAVEAEFWGEVYNDQSAKALLSKLKLSHGVDEGLLTVKTRVASGSLGEDGWINLKIMVPAHLALDIENTSGPIRLAGIDNDVTIDDGRGWLSVTNIGGSLVVDDSSGDIMIRKVAGALKIIDSSGDIIVEEAGADVSIDDSYGDIEVSNVGGSVLIDDGYGDILVRKVEGNLEVTRKRRGDIEHADVKGTVTLPQRRR